MNIVLGISGSIAAYKSPDLVRRLREVGCSVRVVMTKGGQSFITPLTLQAVSGHPVVYDLLDPSHEAGMGHIELARWADLILIAPASANCMARLAMGMADDLLTAICLATEKPIVLAPGMNRLMWRNIATQTNIATLKQRGVHILMPGNGAQACGEIGEGRMLEPTEIRDEILAMKASLPLKESNHSSDVSDLNDFSDLKGVKSLPLTGKRVVITAGPTVEEIDPVRYISNYSSGKMGYALAEKAALMGAEVTLVSGPVALEAPQNVRLIKVKSADEMLAEVTKATSSDTKGACDLFIASAAVADYRVVNRASQKMKKETGQDLLTLTLTQNPDILATIAKGDDRPKLCIGFAAETESVEEHAKAKLLRKNVDMICLNDVSGGKVFGESENEMILFTRSGERIPLPKADKSEIAQQILETIMTLFPNE
ncbi:bifunctional 4'-phosphopantothenoylcysteine decarboxylase/phosphopantothenoylcysteine synthetase [Ignatzschineria ureiclastica]|uniref:Coenzyme A biosynthesis bifunctional protein CoaBC n=1 Tax=Ignatzschineria ureiclastica TaxID=472582 RepID=A0A2U2AD78_9GAMM|nr:bifunctional phosphopantothenoylcysteine decarboxylase/phosphopantothenate--cysteine ligase CoaBC [Ignatzschineria ureiclastica]PWD80614.1 bifunctional 4'-phosphopantothenoylcysteine decarboxylase/phosphopantothenoylcysteine synthetase [Ignatzschineria ureiclastica]GHA02203.1 phosphopantothenoylcysteine decarboxylase [Ignatzschineria ureiclastica]